MLKRIPVFALSVFILSACSTSPYQGHAHRNPSGKADHLTVVALTDFHGALVSDTAKTQSGDSVVYGGGAVLASYVKILREKATGPVLVLDGGDLFQGTLESNLPEGAPVVRLYNAMGVTAAALGNHEFDFGPVGDKSVPRDPGDDARGALKQRIKEAKFPTLAANVLDENGKTPDWLKRSIIVEEGGLRIGVIGAATEDTPSTTNRLNLVGLTFQNPIGPVKKEALRLRQEEKVDAVVLAIHAGGACKDNRIESQGDLTSCQDGEAFRLVRAMPEGLIDVVVAGHTHLGIAKRIGRTVVIQSYARGKQIGWAEVPIGGSDKPRVAGFSPVCGTVLNGEKGKTCVPDFARSKPGKVEPATFLGVPVRPDPEVEALLKPDLEKVRKIKEEELGIQALAKLDRSFSDENPLGNLVADAMRESLDGIDIGVTNGGGLRADIEAGPVRYGDVFEVLPFDNQLAVLTVDGSMVRKIVELGNNGRQGALFWSHLGFSAHGCKITDVEVNGEPLEDDRSYQVVTSDYLATGGSGFDALKLKPEQVQVFWDRPYIMRDAVVRVLKKWKKDLSPKDFYDKTAPRERLNGKCGDSAPGDN